MHALPALRPGQRSALQQPLPFYNMAPSARIEMCFAPSTFSAGQQVQCWAASSVLGANRASNPE